MTKKSHKNSGQIPPNERKEVIEYEANKRIESNSHSFCDYSTSFIGNYCYQIKKGPNPFSNIAV